MTLVKKAKSLRKIDKRTLNTTNQRIYTRQHKYNYKIEQEMQKPFKKVRMFVVEKRNAETLIPIIQQNDAKESEIVSDEWKAYGKLKNHGYDHYTVNHSKNYVDPISGKHTQLIECLWGVAKSKIMRSMKGTCSKNLQGHLAEQ